MENNHLRLLSSLRWLKQFSTIIFFFRSKVEGNQRDPDRVEIPIIRTSNPSTLVSHCQSIFMGRYIALINDFLFSFCNPGFFLQPILTEVCIKIILSSVIKIDFRRFGTGLQQHPPITLLLFCFRRLEWIPMDNQHKFSISTLLGNLFFPCFVSQQLGHLSCTKLFWYLILGVKSTILFKITYKNKNKIIDKILRGTEPFLSCTINIYFSMNQYEYLPRTPTPEHGTDPTGPVVTVKPSVLKL